MADIDNDKQDVKNVGEAANTGRALFDGAMGDNTNKLVNDKPLAAAGLSNTELQAVHTQLASFQAGNIAIARAGTGA